MYFDDILNTKIEKLTSIVCNCLFYYAISPVLICGISSKNHPSKIKNTIAIFILNQILSYITYPPLINIICTILLIPKIPKI